MHHRLLAVALMLAAAASAGAQGLYWEQQTQAFGKQGSSQVYAMPKKIKIVQDDGQEIILRADQEQMIIVDSGRKTYRKMKFSELEAAAMSAQTQMESAFEKAQEQMKNMPPEQRAMIEKMMRNAPGAAAKGADVTVKKTAETKMIHGKNTTKHVATSGNKTVLTAWTTQEVKEFAALRDDWVTLQKRFGKLNRSVAAAAEAYSKIDGFPMQTEMEDLRTEVTKVEPRSLTADLFEAPAGFKEEQTSHTVAPK